MRTITTTVYSFDELNDNAKQKAVENLYDINTRFDWWEYVYSDASEIGLKIRSFDLYRNDIDIDFNLSAAEVSQNILNEHGETCKTHEIAIEFLNEHNPIFSEYLETEEGEDELIEIESKFLKQLSNEYLTILKNELEYLESEEAIIETIQANEYEFTEDGNLC